MSTQARAKKSNEYYTPARFIAAVVAVLGEIDLDPASCEFANRTVKAKRFYTAADNGLIKPWRGKVFCNPPYGRTGQGMSNLAAFVRRLVMFVERGEVNEAILLIPVNTGTSWFDECLWNYYLCFPRKRIRFNTEQGPSDGASFPVVFVYFGNNPQRFIEVFSQFGRTGKLDSGGYPQQHIRRHELWDESEVAV